MINKKFETYKIQREIQKSGTHAKVFRRGFNEFGEPDEEQILLCEFDGLYHEQNSSIQVTTGDTTQVRNKKIPSLLCITNEDIKALKMGDIIQIEEKSFILTGVTDIQEWHLLSDISMEVVDDGF